MPESIFLEEESYYGLREKPLVPSEQVWVFQPQAASPHVVWGSENGAARGPRAPLLARSAMQISKFRRTVTFPATISLFKGSLFPLHLGLAITVTLVDPVSFIELGDYHNDNRKMIEANLKAIIQQALIAKPYQQVDIPGEVFTLGSLLPLTDSLHHTYLHKEISLFMQGYREFRRAGVRICAIVEDISLAISYSKLLQMTQNCLINELQALKSQLQEKRKEALFTTKKQELRKQLCQDSAREYDETLISVEASLKALLMSRRATKHDTTTHKSVQQDTSDFPLSASVFKDVVLRLIDEVAAQDTDSSSDTTLDSFSQAPATPQENMRAAHIAALYQWSARENLELAPPLEKVKEFISIRTEDNCKIELQIPDNYPQTGLLLKVRQDNIPLRQSQVNGIILPIISKGQYDLIVVVKALVNNLRQGSEVK